MAVTADKPGPYAPTSAILDIMGRYRNRGLPSPVNAEVLGRAGISDSLIARTLAALETLDLINAEGNPTPTLEGIRLAPEAEYKKRLEDWLKSAYADVFSFVDPTKDGETRVRDAFRSYRPVGQQDRMVTLFMGLCSAAGLIAEKPAPARAARPSNPALPPRVRESVKRFVQERVIKPAQPPSTSLGLPAPLAGLLASLPADGQGWTAPKRDQFLTTFQAVLDFCIPILPHEPDEDEDAEAA
jgi:Family of unknown function (DUF5343)